MGGATDAADDGLIPCGLGWCRRCENAKSLPCRFYGPFEEDVVYNMP